MYIVYVRYAWFVRVSGKTLQFFGIELLKLFHSHINLLRNVNLPLRKEKKYSRQEYTWERSTPFLRDRTTSCSRDSMNYTMFLGQDNIMTVEKDYIMSLDRTTSCSWDRTASCSSDRNTSCSWHRTRQKGTFDSNFLRSPKSFRHSQS